MLRGVCGKVTQRSFVKLMVMLNKAATDEEPAVVATHFHPYTGPVGVPVPSINAFSALHLLRNYNQLLLPPDVSQRYRQLISQNCLPDDYKLSASSFAPPPSSLLAPHPLLGYQPVAAAAATAPLFTATPNTTSESQLSPVLNRTLSASPRRQRGEKKPIPEDQKDDKYFERRRRNNQAAKKSRDARKMREDQIAFRATMLEHENAILRAQILTLREEASSLRQMLIAKKTDQSQSQTIEHQINCR